MTPMLSVGSRVYHPVFGDGVVINVQRNSYTIRFLQQGVKILKFNAPLTILEPIDAGMQATRKIGSGQASAPIAQNRSYVGEQVKSGKAMAGHKPYRRSGRIKTLLNELPMGGSFFTNLILMDRLRQPQTGASLKNPSEKRKTERYIQKMYGSLTSLRLLYTYQHYQLIGRKIGFDA
ncbi:hypothetical protein HNV11_07820 [Spirosoma taeanense]|uniref:Uncharacterized protein n=1 Tax=Spirosoma taeanense TaxID=2735870 RepID=A0A6M5Y5Z9_9BACT|nr:hypothetical protein [Spirosoma taeanense]QJW89299.1 hypothetical protein HNV11_07820 [Spirosoma taeanense]